MKKSFVELLGFAVLWLIVFTTTCAILSALKLFGVI